MTAAQPAPERHYRCPKCKREVAVLLGTVTVSCSRCGRRMKRVQSMERTAVHG